MPRRPSRHRCNHCHQPEPEKAFRFLFKPARQAGFRSHSSDLPGERSSDRYTFCEHLACIESLPHALVVAERAVETATRLHSVACRTVCAGTVPNGCEGHTPSDPATMASRCFQAMALPNNGNPRNVAVGLTNFSARRLTAIPKPQQPCTESLFSVSVFVFRFFVLCPLSFVLCPSFFALRSSPL